MESCVAHADLLVVLVFLEHGGRGLVVDLKVTQNKREVVEPNPVPARRIRSATRHCVAPDRSSVQFTQNIPAR